MNIYQYCIVLLITLPTFTHLHATPAFAYIVSQATNEIVVVNTQTNAITAAIALPNTSFLYSIAITPNNKYAYVTNGSPSSVYVLDLTMNTLITTITTSLGTEPNGVAVTPDGNYVIVTNYQSTSISIIATQTNTPIAGSPFSVAINFPWYIAISPDGTAAYISDGGGNQVLPVDITNPLNPIFGSPITVGTQPYNVGLAVTSDSNTCYVVNINDNAVYPITNLKTSPTVGTAIPVESEPFGIVLTPNNNTAYVTNSGYNTLSVIDLSIPSITTTLNVGNYPLIPAITSDGKFVYIPNDGDNTISVINTASNTFVGGTPIDLSAYGNPVSIAITTTSQSPTPTRPAAPTHVIGTRKNNVFLDKTDRILTITWDASSSANITTYKIYNGPTFVTNVLATSPLIFSVILANGDDGQNFSITAVNSLGEKSDISIS